MTSISEARGFDPLGLAARSPVQKLFFVLAGTVVLALASQVSVPMVPVPITLQTFAVTVIGALYGWRLGALTVLAWLGEAAIGLPVLSGFKTGAMSFGGPTTGYLAAFPLMAAFTGWLAGRGLTGRRWLASFLVHFAANLLCLALGFAWLSTLVGAERAWIAGVAPFFVGAFLKSALAAGLLAAAARR